MRVVSLFSGIGGFELGLRPFGAEPVLFCESEPNARTVLSAHWPNVEIHPDIRTLSNLPSCEIVTAGFPCQDLSQAGPKTGIAGERSGLVNHLFRLLKASSPRPEWVIIENVSYMLGLDRGAGMRHLIEALEELDYAWAYRVVELRSFGLPHRRARIVLVASQSHNPEYFVSATNYAPVEDPKPSIVDERNSYGFYWTEGKIGLGWVENGIPPIKGGSGLGIPSPPAVWIPETGDFGKPSIGDAEKLQGFPKGWTEAVEGLPGKRRGARWRLVGNAASVPITNWIGAQILGGEEAVSVRREPLVVKNRWPIAACGKSGDHYMLPLSTRPSGATMRVIRNFLSDPLEPLSYRAAAGFRKRALSTPKLVYSERFLDSLQRYCELQQEEAAF